MSHTVELHPLDAPYVAIQPVRSPPLSTGRARPCGRMAVGLAMVLSVSLTAGPAWATTVLTLTEAQHLLVRDNPRLRALAAQAAALASQAVAVAQLPDPRLSVGIENAPLPNLALRQQQMSMLQFGVSQSFPPWGARTARRHRADYEAQAARDGRREKRAELVFVLRKAWLAALSIRATRNAVAAESQLARATLRAAQARYRTGRGAQYDVWRAQLAAGALRNQWDHLKADAAQAQFQIRRLLADPTLPPLDPRWPVLPLPSRRRGRLRLSHQPSLRAAQAQWRAGSAGVALAKSAYWPAVTVSADYGQDFFPGSPNWLSVGLSFSLPIFPAERQDQGVDAARARRLMAQYRYEDRYLALKRQFDSEYALYTAQSRERARTDRVLLPVARAAFTATLAAYSAGRASLTAVLRAQQRILRYTLQSVRYRKDASVAAAALDYLTTERVRGHGHDN